MKIVHPSPHYVCLLGNIPIAPEHPDGNTEGRHNTIWPMPHLCPTNAQPMPLHGAGRRPWHYNTTPPACAFGVRGLSAGHEAHSPGFMADCFTVWIDGFPLSLALFRCCIRWLFVLPILVLYLTVWPCWPLEPVRPQMAHVLHGPHPQIAHP